MMFPYTTELFKFYLMSIDIFALFVFGLKKCHMQYIFFVTKSTLAKIPIGIITLFCNF